MQIQQHLQHLQVQQRRCGRHAHMWTQ
jgi:hypothetical protein